MRLNDVGFMGFGSFYRPNSFVLGLKGNLVFCLDYILEFEMKDLGEAKKILGLEIHRDRVQGKICLSQKQYLKKILYRFGMDAKTKPVSTPLASHFKLSAAMSPSPNDERQYMAQIPYQSAIGSLMYAMVCTRPDISQAVSIVSRYMHDPGKGHWQAVK